MLFPTSGASCPLQPYVTEAEQLANRLPQSRRMVTELTAIVLLARMQAGGYEISIAEADGCLERMRVAVETGVYPEEMLQAARGES